ncbi:SpoIIE family protein phosphatase [Candidatus Gracilibacteria bacterium]|nr:SpoIIE family protein phosphatase [Candidatus Gracilibacteria bacterium]
MFGRKRKEINTENIHTFTEAVKAIKSYIYLKEWDLAESAIQDIKQKEQAAFSELEYKIKNDYRELQKQRRIFEKNMLTITALEKKYEVDKIKYDRRIVAERFKIRFKKIKQEVRKLTTSKNNNEALNLLNHFLEDNKDNSEVITYYAKEKKNILKSIQKNQSLDKKRISDNAELEAIRLAGLTLKDKNEQAQERKRLKEEKKQNGFIPQLIEKLKFHKRMKEKYDRKKLLDEVKILIEEESKAKLEIAEKKLENIHKGLIKEVEKKNMLGFDIFGKILGSDKISGDSIGFTETKNKYSFYIGDATGHGVRAGLIVSLLSKAFQEEAPKDDIVNLTYIVNNTLKENLQSKNFVTGIFFELDKKYKNAFNISGMGHEPLLIYRHKEKKIERVIAGGLAGGIRLIKKIEDIKPKTLELLDQDVVLTYSDGVLEAKDEDNKIYGIERLEKIFLQSSQATGDIREIYNDLIEDLKLYRGGSNFLDDTTILMFRRNSDKDLLNAGSDEIEKIKAKEGLSNKEVKRLEGKTKDQLEEELKEIKKDKQTLMIINTLKGLYYTGEFLKLKQEATRYIREGFIHKKINYYLKKAIDNEEEYKISQRNTKLENKYNVLLELFKKKDFNTVIQECNEIISKDGNI